MRGFFFTWVPHIMKHLCWHIEVQSESHVNAQVVHSFTDMSGGFSDPLFLLYGTFCTTPVQTRSDS